MVDSTRIGVDVGRQRMVLNSRIRSTGCVVVDEEKTVSRIYLDGFWLGKDKNRFGHYGTP